MKYEWFFWIYLALAVLTLLPLVHMFFKGVSLNPSGASFSESPYFSEEAKKRLSQHYSRLMGTLGFWKKRAELFKYFHYYCVTWSILSSWAVPVIASISNADDYSKALLLLVSSHAALALSFHKGLKVADGMKAFRHGESEFYDLYRRLLDQPLTLGSNEEEQITKYFSEVEKIRQFIRSAETESLPTINIIEPTQNTRK